MNTSLEERAARSAVLHRQVTEFAAETLAKRDVPLPFEVVSKQFETLACDIAGFQSGKRCENLAQVVKNAVPADCFKFGHVFQFSAAEATCGFRTSGTTATNTGVHFFRDVQTYQRLSLWWGGLALDLEREPAPIIVALAPWTGMQTTSSLGYMMQRMMERFDGRSLCDRRLQSGFRLEEPLRWLVSETGVDVEGLKASARVAAKVETRLVVLATSFALVELLDALGEQTLPLPTGSVVMPTGGFKGRTRTIEPDEMQRELYRVFGDIDLVGEYGMTELTSQLYEGTARFGELEAATGVYLEPPWLRVVPCDPISLEPVPDGDVGLACFVDLGNIDSAVAVLTQDLVRRQGNGIRLLGRQSAAPIRGCSLAIEALLHPRVRASDTVSSSADDSPVGRENGSSFDAGRERVSRLVRAVLDCKQDVSNSEFELEQLAASSFMSVAGVRLALEFGLETSPSADEVDQLVARARRGMTLRDDAEPTVWVVLSSTVFTAAYRAAALALSISSRVKLKPSRRQPHFARTLSRACNGLFELVEEIAPRAGDVVMVFGSDETIGLVRKSLVSGVSLRGFGHGMGVAVVAAGAPLAESAKGLALDMVLFEQQGCLSPRLVLLDSAHEAADFVEHISAELLAWNEQVPLGFRLASHAAHAAWEQRVAQTFASIKPCGTGWIAEYSEDWCLKHRLPLSSTPRSISVVRTERAAALLLPIAQQITCVGFAGSRSTANELAQLLPKARHVALGAMQRPRFDGPVDLR